MTERPDPNQPFDPGKDKHERDREFDANIARNDNVDAEDTGKIATAAEATRNIQIQNDKQKKKEEERRREQREALAALLATIQRIDEQIEQIDTEISELQQEINEIRDLMEQAKNGELDPNDLDVQARLEKLGIDPKHFFEDPETAGVEAMRKRENRIGDLKHDRSELQKDKDAAKERYERNTGRDADADIQAEQSNDDQPAVQEELLEVSDSDTMGIDFDDFSAEPVFEETAETIDTSTVKAGSFANSLADDQEISVLKPFNEAAIQPLEVVTKDLEREFVQNSDAEISPVSPGSNM